MAETGTNSGPQPKKPIDTPVHDAKQSSHTSQQIPLCASESSSGKSCKVATKPQKRRRQSPSRASVEETPRKDEDTTKSAEQVIAKHNKEDEESDDDGKYAPELPEGPTRQPPTHLSTHVKLRGAFNGERYCFPGVGSPSDDFAVPTAVFAIQEIVGQYLAALVKTPGNALAVQRKKSSEGDTNNEKVSVVLSPAPVCHLLDSLGNVRTHGNLGALADEQNFVQVCFDQTQSKEEYIDIPCFEDVDDISTPETPPPMSPSQ